MSQHPSDVEMSWQQQPGEPAKQKKGWFGRNWKWFVPVVILLPLFCCCGVPFGAFLIYKDEFVNMFDTFTEPIELAQQHEGVAEALGAPLVFGEPYDNQNTSDTTVEMAYPVSGPSGSGEIIATIDISDPLNMQLISAELVVDDTGDRIDLLDPDDRPSASGDSDAPDSAADESQ